MRWLFALRMGGGVTLVILAAFFTWRERYSLPDAPSFVWWPLAGVALIQVGISLANQWAMWLQLRGTSHGQAIPFRPLWRINLWGSLLNLALPFGFGVLLRGWWLQRHHQLALSNIMRHLAHTTLLPIALNLWMLGWLSMALGVIAPSLLLMAGLPLMGWLIWLHRPSRPLLFPMLLPYPLMAASYFLTGWATSIEIPVEFLLLMPIILQLSALVVMAPGSLGVAESLFMGTAILLEMPPGDALWISLVVRACGLCGLATVLPILYQTSEGDPKNRTF